MLSAQPVQFPAMPRSQPTSYTHLLPVDDDDRDKRLPAMSCVDDGTRVWCVFHRVVTAASVAASCATSLVVPAMAPTAHVALLGAMVKFVVDIPHSVTSVRSPKFVAAVLAATQPVPGSSRETTEDATGDLYDQIGARWGPLDSVGAFVHLCICAFVRFERGRFLFPCAGSGVAPDKRPPIEDWAHTLVIFDAETWAPVSAYPLEQDEHCLTLTCAISCLDRARLVLVLGTGYLSAQGEDKECSGRVRTALRTALDPFCLLKFTPKSGGKLNLSCIVDWAAGYVFQDMFYVLVLLVCSCSVSKHQPDCRTLQRVVVWRAWNHFSAKGFRVPSLQWRQLNFGNLAWWLQLDARSACMSGG